MKALGGQSFNQIRGEQAEIGSHGLLTPAAGFSPLWGRGVGVNLGRINSLYSPGSEGVMWVPLVRTDFSIHWPGFAGSPPSENGDGVSAPANSAMTSMMPVPKAFFFKSWAVLNKEINIGRREATWLALACVLPDHAVSSAHLFHPHFRGDCFTEVRKSVSGEWSLVQVTLLLSRALSPPPFCWICWGGSQGALDWHSPLLSPPRWAVARTSSCFT